MLKRPNPRIKPRLVQRSSRNRTSSDNLICFESRSKFGHVLSLPGLQTLLWHYLWYLHTRLVVPVNGTFEHGALQWWRNNMSGRVPENCSYLNLFWSLFLSRFGAIARKFKVTWNSFWRLDLTVSIAFRLSSNDIKWNFIFIIHPLN